MTRTVRQSAPRGFTLVELMIAVAIVGLLSSIAVPEFQKVQMRSKAAERHVIMKAIARTVGDVVQAQQRIPGAPDNVGNWNPDPLTPGARGPMNWSLDGWRRLPMVAHGNTYYQYYWALSPDLVHPNETVLTVMSRGDLNADGDASTLVATYHIQGYAFVQHPDDGESYLTASLENF